MKAIFLIRYGKARDAFKIRQIEIPVPTGRQVLIKVEAFGLNFADVMARKNLYKEAPPLPCILGYEVVGTVTARGSAVNNVDVGHRVIAMTRFGGYAEYVLADSITTVQIAKEVTVIAATAMATQYCTAYYAAAQMVNISKGDKVLVHSGAGGVGTAIIQYARYRQCEIFSTAGTGEKIQYLNTLGVTHAINYNTHDFENEIKNITEGKGVDVIFDAVGGLSVKKGFRSLAPGGRIVCYGASAMTNKNIFGKAKAAFDFGLYHPLMFMMASKAMIGINMLKIADSNPSLVRGCLEQVVKFTGEKIFSPGEGKVFFADEISVAHEFLEKRSSIGKIAVKW